jgi:SAM-dependent methyltransferase
MMKLLARFRNAWQRHSAAEFVKLLGVNLVYYLFKRRHGGPEAPGSDSFDQKYGTETSGIREIGSLDIAGTSARFAVRYQPSSEESVNALIDGLGIDYDRFSFIDYGSGKGRVLLIAAAFPFASVTGVEFSPELQEIAARNVARLPASMNPDGRVRSVCCDAAEFEPPAGDLVCYFYNPFDAPVMKRVVDRLLAHHRRQPCRILVLYVDPRHRGLFEETGQFEAVGGDASMLILSTLERSDLARASNVVA